MSVHGCYMYDAKRCVIKSREVLRSESRIVSVSTVCALRPFVMLPQICLQMTESGSWHELRVCVESGEAQRRHTVRPRLRLGRLISIALFPIEDRSVCRRALWRKSEYL
jgi:hypothetical protein